MKRLKASLTYSLICLLLLTFGHIVSSQAQANFTPSPITINGRSLFDMGVADVNNDNFLDIFTSNHTSEQSLLLRNQNGVYRDCLDHVIVLNERHLKQILNRYFGYNHRWRTHLSLEMDSPDHRAVHSPAKGKVVAFP